MTTNPRTPRAWRVLPALLLLAALGACSDGGTGPDTRVRQVSVTAPATTVESGETLQLTAAGSNRAGEAVSGAYTWSSSNTGVATITAGGQAQAIAPGTTTFTATESASGVAGALVLTVVEPRVQTVEVTPATATIFLTRGQTVTATLRDTRGAILTGRAITWTSSNPAVASVTLTGFVAGVGLGGPVDVTATVEGRTATARITVVPAPVHSLAIDPPGPHTLQAGTTRPLAAVARDDQGAVLTGRPLAWSTSDPAVATITPQGVLTGVAPGGPVTITATVEGVAAATQVTITEVPVASVAVSPAAGTVLQGSTTQLTAVARDAAGNLLTGRAVAWSSADPSLAGVSPTGLVTGVAAGGPVAITATSGGRSGTAQVTITPRVAARVALEPAFTVLEVGGSQTLRVRAEDAAGVAIPAPVATWTSANTGTAPVDAAGRVNGMGVGYTRVAARVNAASDTAFVAVLGARDLLSTAFAGGQPRAAVRAGQTVTVPVTLDLSRVSATGDLGAVQFQLQYDPGTLVYQSAQAGVTGSADVNPVVPGTLRFAFAGTAPQGRSALTLVTLTFVVAPAARVGAHSELRLTYAVQPTAVDLAYYSLPVAVGGHVRVVSP